MSAAAETAAAPAVVAYPVLKAFTFNGRRYERGDSFDAAAAGAEPHRIRTMIAARLLVPAGDVQEARLRSARRAAPAPTPAAAAPAVPRAAAKPSATKG